MSWYYARNGQTTGPVEFDAIVGLLKNGSLTVNDLAWTASFGQEWKPIGAIPEFQAAMAGASSQSRAATADNRELMRRARASLKGNWSACVGVMAVVGVLSLVAGNIGNLLFTGVIRYGFATMFLRVVREGVANYNDMLSGFPKFLKTVWAHVWITLCTFWPLMVVLVIFAMAFGFSQEYAITIAGILLVPACIYVTVADCCYSMTYFILVDRRDISVREAVYASKVMMYGYKWKLCCLRCRFIGWILLSVLTLGIGFLFLSPYMMAAEAHFYENLKSKL